jgi:uncharacterized membrane protein
MLSKEVMILVQMSLKYFQLNWKKIIFFLVGGLVLCLAVYHDAELYHQPIGEVIQVKSLKKTSVTDNFNNHDVSQEQRLKVKILNGKSRNHIIYLKNNFSTSEAASLAYHSGEQLFLKLHQHQSKNQSVIITGLKRDTMMVFLCWLTIFLLSIIVGIQSYRMLFSIILNLVLFFLAIKIDVITDAQNVIFIFAILAIAFLAITEFLVFGKGRQFLVCFSATFLGTGISLIIAITVLLLTHENGLNFEMMSYVTQERLPLYLAGCIIGSLGAVMDLATDITSGLFILAEKNSAMTFKDFWHSGQNIGKTVLGSLINVLLLIFISSVFPLAVLFIRNGNNWNYLFPMLLSLGIVQSLISGIGIALTIPLTSTLTGLVLRKEVSHE